MRTTLAIDDDVLMAAKELAEMQRKSLGEVITLLVRKALRPDQPVSQTRNGIPLLPLKLHGTRVTSEMVRQLDEELP